MPIWLILIIVGIIALIVAYNITMPAPLNQIAKVAGWICLAVGAVLFIVGLLGIA